MQFWIGWSYLIQTFNKKHMVNRKLLLLSSTTYIFIILLNFTILILNFTLVKWLKEIIQVMKMSTYTMHKHFWCQHCSQHSLQFKQRCTSSSAILTSEKNEKTWCLCTESITSFAEPKHGENNKDNRLQRKFHIFNTLHPNMQDQHSP